MKTVVRVLWFLSGLLLIVAGAYGIFHPLATLGWVAYLFGVVAIFSGIFSIIAYVHERNQVMGAGWLLFDGILTILVAILLLCTDLFLGIVALLPYLMGAWLALRGVSCVIHSFDLKRLGMPDWGGMTVIGALVLIIGVLALFMPGIAAVLLSAIIGITLISYGVTMLFDWYVAGKIFKMMDQ